MDYLLISTWGLKEEKENKDKIVACWLGCCHTAGRVKIKEPYKNCAWVRKRPYKLCLPVCFPFTLFSFCFVCQYGCIIFCMNIFWRKWNFLSVCFPFAVLSFCFSSCQYGCNIVFMKIFCEKWNFLQSRIARIVTL